MNQRLVCRLKIHYGNGIDICYIYLYFYTKEGVKLNFFGKRIIFFYRTSVYVSLQKKVADKSRLKLSD